MDFEGFSRFRPSPFAVDVGDILLEKRRVIKLTRWLVRQSEVYGITEESRTFGVLAFGIA